MPADKRPLFGAGSGPSKHGRKPGGFLRPGVETDGRLHPVSQASQSLQIPASPINGTKAMRQTVAGGGGEINPATSIPTIAQQPPVQHQPVQQQPMQPSPAQQAQGQQPHGQPVAQPLAQQQQAAIASRPLVQQQQMQQQQMQQQQMQQSQMQPPLAPVATQPLTQQPQPAVAQAPQLQQDIPTEPTGSIEDRAEPRKRTLKGGMVVLPGHMMSSYACKIRNESRGGVMLVLPDSMLLPGEFYLVRDADPGHKIPCRVAWRGIGRVGVQFIAALAAP